MKQAAVGDFTFPMSCTISRCTDLQWVQQRMVRENLFVDLVGVSGKKLLSQRDLGKRGTTKGAALLRHYIDSV